ncbi:MAG: SMP-30/gluconolactonase/LRE family protein, partial [Dehalococcoidia bacterium]
MRIENDEGLSDLLRSSEETRLCTGFVFTEGPLWVVADECLLFSDIPGNRMHRWRPGSAEAELYREPSGFSNGLTLDGDGNVLAAEHGGRRVSRAPYDGGAETVVGDLDGKTLNSPNDLVVHSDGAIYFTDPTYGLPRPGAQRVMGNLDAKQEIDFKGLYRIDTDGSLTVLVDDFDMPNGLAFSPDESLLYVA